MLSPGPPVETDTAVTLGEHGESGDRTAAVAVTSVASEASERAALRVELGAPISA
jgi:hypothetical protein